MALSVDGASQRPKAKRKNKNMGYPNFGKVRTLTLPFTGAEEEMSIDEYKKLYGIDLRDILALTPTSFEVNAPDSLILLANLTDSYFVQPAVIYRSANKREIDFVTMGLDDAKSLVIANGLILKIPEGKELSLDNILITGYNV